MKKNKDRKRDTEIIKEVFNWNDYHPNTVKVKFNKMNWFYEIEVGPANPEKENYIEWFTQKAMLKLHSNDLIILQISFSRNFKPGFWSSEPDARLSDTVEHLRLRIGRRDEFFQYKGYQY